MNLFRMLAFVASHPLNRHGKLAAVSRFARWQAAIRVLPGPKAMPFVNDTVLVMERGMVGATGNWYCGLHEPDDMAFVLHALRPGDLFADIGANVGSYTVLAAGAVGAEVVAVEPLPATYARLVRNVRMNNLDAQVEAVCQGLSDKPGEIAFVSSLDAQNRVALPGETLPTQIVPVSTLDSLLAGRIPKVIKMDVEGHESWVLQGGVKTLANPGLAAVLMETNQSGAKFGVDDAALVATMHGHGFTSRAYDPFTRTIGASHPGSANTIFVRDPAAVQAICREAPRFTLVNGTI